MTTRQYYINRAGVFLFCAVLLVFLIPAGVYAQNSDETDSEDVVPELIGSITPKRATQTSMLQFEVYADTSGGVIPTLRAANLPTGARFDDSGNGRGAFYWTPRGGQVGEFVVTFDAVYPPTAALAAPEGPQDVPILVSAYPLSHGLYRIAYDDGDSVKVTRDHTDHTPPLKIDMIGIPFAAPHRIVAAADGRIMEIVDVNTTCCNVSGCENCNNHVRIKHPNGEWTKYTHFKTGTVTGDAGLVVGQCVTAGTFLGWEGDIGHTSGSGSSNRDQVPCIYDVNDTLKDTTDVNEEKKCGIHLHFEVRANSATSKLRIPLICGISNNVYASSQKYEAAVCDPTDCTDWLDMAGLTYDGNTIEVLQASDSIRATTVMVTETASVAMFAGKRIILKPGFRASTNSYFHAMINDCNSVPSGCPPP
jgi:hypothetical protein